MQLPNHGANPHRLYEQLKMPMPKKIIDFSENVNPFGLPPRIKEAWPSFIENLTAYPDPEADPFLRRVARFHHIPKEYIFVGNGAAEIFTLLAMRYRKKKAIVVHPTFSEYESTLRAKRAEIIPIIASELKEFELPLETIKSHMLQADVLYLCTPNNPTGVLPSQRDIRQLIEHGKSVGCDLVLDEAFIDFVDESLSFIPSIQANNHVIVVRSMTKMYAIPGIRLGYVVAHPAVIQEIRSQAPHWNVSSIAAEIGAKCLKEEAFVKKTKDHSRMEREKMKAFLIAKECTVTNSVANYLSFKLKDRTKTAKLYKDLLQRGIVLRHSKNFLGMDGNWLRLGIKREDDMALLRKELSRWFGEN